MGKYDPLAKFLSRQRTGFVELSFAEIERLLGSLLPKAAAAGAWWKSDGPHTKAWRTVGFAAALLGQDERVRFDREADPMG